MINLQKLNGLTGDEREFERLKMLYPLFQFEREGKHLTVHTSKSSSFHPWLENGRIGHEAEQHLNHDHMVKSMSQSLMSLYPDLYISVYAGKDGAKAHVWMKRNDSDAEAIGSVDIVSPFIRITLKKWQKEAEQAKQKGWFFCSGHVRAEKHGDGDYFYFAGNYCKQWGDEHPESRKEAARETYN
jgi:hypothetical protein